MECLTPLRARSIGEETRQRVFHSAAKNVLIPIHRLLVLGKLNELVKSWVVKMSIEKVRSIHHLSTSWSVFLYLSTSLRLLSCDTCDCIFSMHCGMLPVLLPACLGILNGCHCHCYAYGCHWYCHAYSLPWNAC